MSDNGSNGNGHNPEFGGNTEPKSELTGRERSLANLMPPWPKGVSGHPEGRPRKPITEAYVGLAEKPFPGDPQKRTYAQLAAEGAFKSAIKGKTDAIKEITDRIEGPVNRDLIDSGGAPITINITFE